VQSGASATFTVQKRTFARTLRLGGTIQPLHSVAIQAPRLHGESINSMVLTKLATPGSQVKVGDILAEFDAQTQNKDFLDRQSKYNDFVLQVAQKKAEEDINKAKDDLELKKAEDDLAKSNLEVKKNEIVSRIDAEKARQAVDEAQSTLQQLKFTYDLKRQAATAAIRILEIQRDRARESMRYAESNTQNMVLHAPMEGTVVLITTWLGERGMGTVQQGDEVRAGVAFLEVVDTSRMEVQTEVNETDVLRLRAGLHAKLHLDAYPDISLPAVLSTLAPLGREGRYATSVHTFEASFEVQGSDPRLMPDLSAAVDVELDSIPDAVVVPIQSVGGGPGREKVAVQAGVGFEDRAVRTGARNDVEVVVESGLAGGEVIRRMYAQTSTKGTPQ
jgi:multidrug efflux pump subunit AcrA (membrane-fusion protein)